MQRGIIFALVCFSLFRSILQAQTVSTATIPADGAAAVARQESIGGDPAKPQAADLSSLKAQIDALRFDYERRIRALETQLEELQAQMLRIPTEEEALVAPPAQRPPAQVTYNALNPAISVIGNFLGRADSRKVFNGNLDRIDNRLNLRETEIDMRVPVDPYADAVLITSFESENPGEFSVDVEEGYVNIKKLPFLDRPPLGLKLKVGRFRPAFGKFNILHTHDLPQSFRSLPTQEFLGEEGFIQHGFSTNFFIPAPGGANQSLDATLEVLGGGGIAISPQSHDRLAYLGHLRWFRTLKEVNNVELGWSSYWHPGRDEARIARLHAVDFMYRWKPFRQGEWKSYLLGGELLFSDPVRRNLAEPPEITLEREPAPIRASERPFGYSVFTQWQFDRRKYAGVRWDSTQTLLNPTLSRRSLTPYLSYYFSDFLRVRLNYERRWSDLLAENKRNSVFLEVNWVFGAHPPEPFWVSK